MISRNTLIEKKREQETKQWLFHRWMASNNFDDFLHHLIEGLDPLLHFLNYLEFRRHFRPINILEPYSQLKSIALIQIPRF